MLKKFFALIIFLLLTIDQNSIVYASDQTEVKGFLESREKLWPNWKLPNLKYTDIDKDLIYPNWFEGDWIITSEDIKDKSQKPIHYTVNFYKNDSGNIVGNRSKNAFSIGKEIFGKRLNKVINDPQSFNNQIIYLNDNEYIESRVKERTQFFEDELFFADEFAIQTVHKSEASRINQVEIMSKFYPCNKLEIYTKEEYKGDICGFQYLATYGSNVGYLNKNVVSQSKYKLTFKYLGNEH